MIYIPLTNRRDNRGGLSGDNQVRKALHSPSLDLILGYWKTSYPPFSIYSTFQIGKDMAGTVVTTGVAATTSVE